MTVSSFDHPGNVHVLRVIEQAGSVLGIILELSLKKQYNFQAQFQLARQVIHTPLDAELYLTNVLSLALYGI